ncbi:hypothetical protein GE061_003682 [Apolygus lucorum]|uniref:SCP domain-containing protein n=1 Tax=Apolygus lucorum TaxID=248454 RepID=A0A8S9X454_APOLU|nr:hypothetical protein GE061_003682 [Apolygus lucorum]
MIATFAALHVSSNYTTRKSWSVNVSYVAQGKECSGLRDILTQEDREKFEEIFNHKRLKATSAASSDLPNVCPGFMRTLIWGEKQRTESIDLLMEFAKSVLKCASKRNDEESDFYYEGNVIRAFVMRKNSAPTTPLETLIQSWFSPLEAMPGPIKADLIQRYRTGSWHCATQVLWANTEFFGCSIVLMKFERGTRGIFGERIEDPLFVRYVLCLFEPAGNIRNEPVYPVCNKPVTEPSPVPTMSNSSDSPADVTAVEPTNGTTAKPTVAPDPGEIIYVPEEVTTPLPPPVHPTKDSWLLIWSQRVMLYLIAFLFAAFVALRCSAHRCDNLTDILTLQDREVFEHEFNFNRLNATSPMTTQLPTACPGSMRALTWNEEKRKASINILKEVIRTQLQCTKRTRQFAMKGVPACLFDEYFISARVLNKMGPVTTQLSKVISSWFVPLAALGSEVTKLIRRYDRPGDWSCATQILWANTASFGCSIVNSQLSKSDASRLLGETIHKPVFVKYILCAFEPPGNIWNEPVYPMCDNPYVMLICCQNGKRTGSGQLSATALLSSPDGSRHPLDLYELTEDFTTPTSRIPSNGLWNCLLGCGHRIDQTLARRS